MKTYRTREQLHEELIPHLLLSRGIPLPQHDAFLHPEFERDSHDPFLLPGMGAAVERILGAAKGGERLAVWSDYDCDGIPGGVMLSDFLRTIGLSVRHYIPHRHAEGYGLNEGGIDELAALGITLIITIDLGTTEHGPIRYAKTKGIDVVVTDHHLVHDMAELPEAFALINPKRPDSRYPFDGLCGAGVAWKLVQAILEKNRFGLAPGSEKWYLDLVGLATLSDMVPLVGENRMLARFGLLVMRKNRRPGLAQLLALMRIKPSTLTEDDVGFMISPRINAASRMDSPQLSAQLLSTKDRTEALELARTLDSINSERKGLVASMVKEANKRLAEKNDVDEPLIVMGNPNWRPGVLGLVANSLMLSHGKPVFLWGREYGSSAPGESAGLLRGSCRSGGASVVELMQGASDLFAHFGGHTASGGFALEEGRVHELAGRLRGAYDTLRHTADAAPEVLVDRQLDVADVRRTHQALGILSPFGVQNTKPLFLLPNVSIASVRAFGKAKDHVELQLERDGERIAGVSFFSTPDSYQKHARAGERADVVGHVETDWRGGPRLRVVDVL